MLFHTLPFKYYLYKKCQLSIKDFLLLIHTFMCMLIFLRIIILNFQSHQIRILSGVWEWRGNGNDCPVIHILEMSIVNTRPPSSIIYPTTPTISLFEYQLICTISIFLSSTKSFSQSLNRLQVLHIHQSILSIVHQFLAEIGSLRYSKSRKQIVLISKVLVAVSALLSCISCLLLITDYRT